MGEVEAVVDRGVLVRVVVDGAVPPGVVAGGVKVLVKVGGELMIERTPESWCAAKAAMPPASARMPTAMTVPTIHHMRLPEEPCGGGPPSGPP
ncbi:hypothetical protein A5679_01905 [Mycobacterium scrofulaceum]|uniref:Uncharacterized protein n=1 Tax=Mycobacterium scrofulaceum TaxID=1783 RepID=A0A1A2UW25_MYCSC|nr:hypothetical protein A5679_01905 [Mycobacterium scrofulaceum]